MGRDDVPIRSRGEVAETEKMPLRAIEEAADGQIDQHGPALSVVAGRLLRESDVREWKRAEVVGVDLRGHLSLAKFVGQHGRGVERTEGCPLSWPRFGELLRKICDRVRALLVGVGINRSIAQ